MTRRYLRVILAGSLLSLTACAPQSEVRQMHQSISTLNKEMNQLNQETVKITQQNKLNVDSTRGVYLLPGANTPARLKSQIGTLRMTLLDIAPVADGTHAMLRIQGESRDPLPAFSATIEYGQIQGTTENYQEVDVQRLLVNASASLLAPSDVNIPLQLKSITPERLGFIRIHDIQPVNQ
ncbi:DUF3251 domain-containing protein [Salmonella enterica subsp. arizonae]|uniref:Lipoprotein n=1 Tax=Salmonella enterica subsp. arizonae TaxID=59203 RepID=A0A379SYQ5_SALER|nr:DUF3251 domain-containing protein [Salmonella enterica subsp. arizonae]EDW1852777.1 DUF3251 domain-containing protein [Salmonella enterica subsp. diarizonae]EII7930576.1 DUF3251 domain-containing protein [Salmonella enterica]EJT2852469.1 DUF3251 domain-containing protein [Salmonella enterica]EMD9725561.1 DUF3251 domain-containing protein [Salmonella enterica]